MGPRLSVPKQTVGPLIERKSGNNLKENLVKDIYSLYSLGRAVGTAAAMAAALFGLSVFLFTENPLKCFIL